jgi:indolepyruvate ferredoxin oxidoreductase beta subunit
VLALTPGIGDIDVMVASELMEAARAIGAGFVTPERTLMIASTHRFYAMEEKIQMGDGRADSARLMHLIEEHARENLVFDMDALAKRSGSIINSVMLGAIAGSGCLPLSPEAFEAAIRRDGKSVDGNLKGFRAGLTAARHGAAARSAGRSAKRGHAGISSLADLEARIVATLPAAAHDVMTEGVRRLVAYQDLAYARLFVDRLAPIAQADAQAGAGGRLVRDTARQLAVRMSFEDVIRVAQAKIDPARFGRIVGEMKIAPDEPFTVVEFLKPGIEEMCSILPPRLARPILAFAERRSLVGRLYWGMEIKTTSVSGYLRFRLLASLRRFRPSSHRFKEEQRAIESWLDLVGQGAKLSADLALEIVECARLIKGYGDTHKRGSANYQTIEACVIAPSLAGHIPVRSAIDAIASARTAALVDPDGESLARCLADIERLPPRRLAAE